MATHEHHCGCSSSGCCGARAPGVTRRQFMASTGAVTLAGALYGAAGYSATRAATRPARPNPQGNEPLRMQPVLVYEIPAYREAASWRNWGGLITEEHAEEERRRINAELEAMKAKVDFPLELLPLVSVRNAEEAEDVAAEDHDGVIIYGAGCGTGVLVALADPAKLNVMFVRHRSGPAYLWYEIVHPRFLRRESDEFQKTGNMNIQDVVVDDYDELLWRLRALNGVKGIRGKRVVCIGGAGGWGHSTDAPSLARELWDLDLVDVSNEELGERIEAARNDSELLERCKEEARAYLEQPGVTLLPRQENLTTAELMAGRGSEETLDEMRTYFENAFVLAEIFKDLMDEHETDTITVQGCMGWIIPLSETTACYTLTLLNDSGYLAFCESDFHAIPSGILLHHISGKPVFFCNPTLPHRNMTTVAHCAAPRKMDGENLEPVYVRTHFESDYGAAPKVEMPPGQELTVLIQDFASERWIGFEGAVLENPSFDICTTQLDISIKGDCAKLAEEMGGFHWMICYGNYLRETGYALRKAGIGWLNLSEET